MSVPELRQLQRVDLHMHTDRSDGVHPPEEVLRRAAAAGLGLIALTDHDLAPLWSCGPQEVDGARVHVLHAAELTACHDGRELHLLVYFPGDMPEDFRAFCREQARARAERYETARARLDLPGIPPADEEAWAGRRSITRVHLSRALVAQGHARSVTRAFDELVGQHTRLVPLPTLSMAAAIAAARASGGLCSWAHPPLPLAQAYTPTFARAGLHALEGLRPGLGHSVRKALKTLAQKHGLLLTGGSDWHGTPGPSLGMFTVDPFQIAPFAQALWGLDPRPAARS